LLPAGSKYIEIIFSDDMRNGKNSSQPASVPRGRAQQAADLTQKGAR
jgi:hypothetical protein